MRNKTIYSLSYFHFEQLYIILKSAKPTLHRPIHSIKLFSFTLLKKSSRKETTPSLYRKCNTLRILFIALALVLKKFIFNTVGYNTRHFESNRSRNTVGHGASSLTTQKMQYLMHLSLASSITSNNTLQASNNASQVKNNNTQYRKS